LTAQHSDRFVVAIVGATGAVGTELLKVLEDRNFPVSDLRLFASAYSKGRSLLFRNEPITLEVAEQNSFDDCDIAILSAGSAISKELRPWMQATNCLMIDNSSAFRMEEGVPLVIPEINPEDLDRNSGIIAVPNCSTIIMLMAVAPLRTLGRIKRIVVSTYQAVSGAGAKAMKELEDQTRDHLDGKPLIPHVLPYPIAFNLFSHNTKINDAGYNQEEWKMIHETKKILHDEEIAVTATCVRVPVLRAHSESVNVEFFDQRPSLAEIRDVLCAYPGVHLVDDRAGNHFPMPCETAGIYDVHVGRIREDVSNSHAIELFVSGDQLLKGAALGAVQIAETMIKRKLISPKKRAVVKQAT
jgi:aspartate-semialdehyde dehydrogenase